MGNSAASGNPRPIGRLLAAVWSGNRDYAGNALTDVAVAAAGFLSSVMIARGLGPEGRGQLTAALLWPGALSVLGTLGLSHAFAYAVGAGWAPPRRLARFGVAYSLVVGLPLAALFYWLSPLLYHAQFEPVSQWVRLFSVFIPLSIWLGLWWEIFRGAGDFLRWNIVKLLRGVGYTVWIGAALLAGVGTVRNVLWSQVAIALAALAFLFHGLHRAFPRTQGPPIPMNKVIHYGLAVYASSIFYMLNQQLDQLLLSLYVSPESLGQYATAVSLSSIIVTASASVSAVAFARLANSRGDAQKTKVQIKRALLIGTSVLLPAGVCLTVLAPLIVRFLYGPLFDPAGRVLRILAPAAVLLGGGNLLADLLRGAGKPLIPTYAMAFGVVLTVPGLAWLLPRYGMWAAAWVSLAAYGAMLAVQAAGLLRMARQWP